MEWNCLAYQVKSSHGNVSTGVLLELQKAQFVGHTKIPILLQKGNKESVLSISLATNQVNLCGRSQ